MSIEVTCPQGHVLKVKDRYAGKMGLCPYCKSKVQVPVSDDAVLDMLGGMESDAPEAATDEGQPVADDHVAHEEVQPVTDDHVAHHESGISLLGRAVIHKKWCSKCSEEVPFWYATCPRCKQPFE